MGIPIINEQFLPVAESLVKQAKNEILISSFKIEINDRPRGRNLKNFFDEVIKKANEGIHVKVLVNWHDDRRSVPRTNYPAGLLLKNAGVKVRYLKNNRCCHAKILIVDRQQVIIGSHNLSIRSCESNFEISHLTNEESTVNMVCHIFDHVFKDGKDF